VSPDIGGKTEKEAKGANSPPKGLEIIFKRPDGPDLSTGNGFGCQGPDVATFRLFCSEVP
jgi:hypothetical protein